LEHLDVKYKENYVQDVQDHVTMCSKTCSLKYGTVYYLFSSFHKFHFKKLSTSEDYGLYATKVGKIFLLSDKILILINPASFNLSLISAVVQKFDQFTFKISTKRLF
jgi:hypothetical protein